MAFAWRRRLAETRTKAIWFVGGGVIDLALVDAFLLDYPELAGRHGIAAISGVEKALRGCEQRCIRLFDATRIRTRLV